MSNGYQQIQTKFTGCHNGVSGAGGCPAQIALSESLGTGQVFIAKGATQKTNANVLWYIPGGLALIPGTTRFLLEYDLMTDTNPTHVLARERDLRRESGGYDANFSSQLLQQADGTYSLEISNQAGGWVPTGAIVPALTPSVFHHFRHIGSYNDALRTYSYELEEIDGIPYPIPIALQNLKQTKLNPPWADGFYPQFQQDVTEAAGQQGLGFSEWVMNMNLVAW